MLHAVRGRVVGKSPVEIILETSAGLIFSLVTPVSSSSTCTVGEDVVLLTHVQIYPQQLQAKLFGFATAEERDLFKTIIDISGIGPSVAIKILSSGSIDQVRDAIVNGDIPYFKKIKGVGAKIAEKIIFALKEYKGFLAIDKKAAPRSEEEKEATEALVSLGYKADDVQAALKKIPNVGDLSSQEIVTQILRM